MRAIAPFVLTVSGGVLYHLAAKAVPPGLNPALILIGAYGASFTICVVLWLLGRPANMMAALGEINHPAIWILGLAAVLIEVGYVLTYRASWSVGVAPVITTSLVTVVLLAAALALGERPTLSVLAGVALCLAGVALLRN